MLHPVLAEVSTAIEKITEAAEHSGTGATLAVLIVVVLSIILLVNLMVWLDNRVENQTMKREELREKQLEEREKIRSEQTQERETLRDQLWTSQLSRYEEALKLLVASASETNKSVAAMREAIVSMDKRMWNTSQLEDMMARRNSETMQKHVERYHERPGN